MSEKANAQGNLPRCRGILKKTAYWKFFVRCSVCLTRDLVFLWGKRGFRYFHKESDQDKRKKSFGEPENLSGRSPEHGICD